MKDIPNNNLENDQPSRKRVKLHSPGEEFAENGSNNGIQAHLNNDKVIHKIPRTQGTFALTIPLAEWTSAFSQTTPHLAAACLQHVIVSQSCVSLIKTDSLARGSIVKIILIGVNWIVARYKRKGDIDPKSFPEDFEEIIKLPLPPQALISVVRGTLIYYFTRIVYLLLADQKQTPDYILDLSVTTPVRFWDESYFDLSGLEEELQLCKKLVSLPKKNPTTRRSNKVVRSDVPFFGDSAVLTLKEITLQEFYLLKPNGGVEPILKSADCSESHVVIITLEDSTAKVSRSHAFAKTTWTAVEEMFKTQGAIAVGKQFLLSKLFEEDELKTQTPCGRQSPKYIYEGQLDPQRQYQILDTLRYLITFVQTEISGENFAPWSRPVEVRLRTQVLTEGTNVLRGRLNRKYGTPLRKS